VHKGRNFVVVVVVVVVMMMMIEKTDS